MEHLTSRHNRAKDHDNKVMVTLRITKEERNKLNQAAKDCGLSLNYYLRLALDLDK